MLYYIKSKSVCACVRWHARIRPHDKNARKIICVYVCVGVGVSTKMHERSYVYVCVCITAFKVSKRRSYVCVRVWRKTGRRLASRSTALMADARARTHTHTNNQNK